MGLTCWNKDRSQETSRYQKGDTTRAAQSWKLTEVLLFEKIIKSGKERGSSHCTPGQS